MFDYRMLKRKDSESGQYVDGGIRATLLNELRTSDAARRQQQRICGSTVALTFNFLVAVAIILTNKSVLEKVGFNFPIALTFLHYSVSWMFMCTLNALSLLPAPPPLKTTPFPWLVALGVVMAFSNGLANVSLKYNSVGFYQMAKIAVTPTIVFTEYLLFGKRVSIQKGLALTVVSVGVAIATVTDLEFHIFGALVALTWIVPSAVNKILWSNLQQQDGWTALALMWRTTPVTLLCLLLLMPWLDPPGLLSFNWHLVSASAVLSSAVLGFLLQWSGALALGATSATSHVVLGQFKTCVILLAGFVFFHSNPGAKSLSGATMALTGMAFYTFLNVNKTETGDPSAKTSVKKLLGRESQDAV